MKKTGKKIPKRKLKQQKADSQLDLAFDVNDQATRQVDGRVVSFSNYSRNSRKDLLRQILNDTKSF